MISPISLNKKSFNSVNQDHTKRADTDHPPCQHTLVFSQLTSISTEERSTIGVHAVTPKTVHGAMVNASGSWPDADQLASTFQSQVTTNSATASFLQTHHSAMALINTCSSGSTNITEVSGVFGESSLSGDAWATGCSLSTSENLGINHLS